MQKVYQIALLIGLATPASSKVCDDLSHRVVVSYIISTNTDSISTIGAKKSASAAIFAQKFLNKTGADLKQPLADEFAEVSALLHSVAVKNQQDLFTAASDTVSDDAMQKGYPSGLDLKTEWKNLFAFPPRNQDTSLATISHIVRNMRNKISGISEELTQDYKDSQLGTAEIKLLQIAIINNVRVAIIELATRKLFGDAAIRDRQDLKYILENN